MILYRGLPIKITAIEYKGGKCKDCGLEAHQAAFDVPIVIEFDTSKKQELSNNFGPPYANRTHSSRYKLDSIDLIDNSGYSYLTTSLSYVKLLVYYFSVRNLFMEECIMAEFNISFQVQGTGEVQLPVTPLDDLIVMINGLEVKTFRFSVQNILASDITLNVTATESGSTANKISVTFDSNPVTIPAGQSVVIQATITPSEPLLESDPLIDVAVLGTQV